MMFWFYCISLSRSRCLAVSFSAAQLPLLDFLILMCSCVYNKRKCVRNGFYFSLSHLYAVHSVTNTTLNTFVMLVLGCMKRKCFDMRSTMKWIKDRVMAMIYVPNKLLFLFEFIFGNKFGKHFIYPHRMCERNGYDVYL